VKHIIEPHYSFNFSSTLFLLYPTWILWAFENEQKVISYLCGSAFNTKNG